MEPPLPPPADALRRLGVGAVRRCAVALGVTPDEVDDAEETDDEKSCLVDLTVERLTSLKLLKPKQLRAYAVERGLTPERVAEESEGADDRKAAIIQLLFDTVLEAESTASLSRSSSVASPSQQRGPPDESPTPASQRWTRSKVQPPRPSPRRSRTPRWGARRRRACHCC